MLQDIEIMIEATSGCGLQELEKLACDMRELILLTEQSILLVGPSTKHEISHCADNVADDFDEEYEKFKAEIGMLENASTSESNTDKNASKDLIEDLDVVGEFPELASLEGQKCRAPFSHSWGGLDYHNAMIVSIEPIDYSEGTPNVKVRVLYLLPTHETMKTCKYLLDGKCHYGADECRFSHGQVVSLQTLREYEEPNYSHLREFSKILCRYSSDDLWYSATVQSLKEEGRVLVRYDEYPKDDVDVAIEDVWPIAQDNEASDDETDEFIPLETDTLPLQEELELETIRTDFLLKDGNFSALGEWEKYTKGFGSKMMTKLGYVMGMGLGKQGEGRVEPVDAVVLPHGRSLDRCMELKEKAGEESLLTVEKRLKRQQISTEKKAKRDQEKADSRQNHFKTLFDVLNSRLNEVNHSAAEPKALSRKESASELKKESSKNLNIQNFKISEDIRKSEKDLQKLKEILSRQMARSDKKAVENVQRQISSKENELRLLQNSEKAINRERDSRSSKKKMQIF